MRFQCFRSPVVLISLLLLIPVVCERTTLAESKRVCLQRSQPDYPEIARRMRIQGAILLDVSVEPDGHVSNAKIASGHPMLAAAAQQAVMRWKFAPAAEAEVIPIRIDFKL